MCELTLTMICYARANSGVYNSFFLEKSCLFVCLFLNNESDALSERTWQLMKTGPVSVTIT